MAWWKDYYLNESFKSFWEERLKNSNVRILIIPGIGFDPRSLVSLKIISNFNINSRLGFLALNLKSRPAIGKSGEVMETLAKNNLDELHSIDHCIAEGEYEIEIHDSEGHYVGGRRALSELSKCREVFQRYTDVLVDISGMPRGIFFPLISYLIKLANDKVFQNLHITVVEDPILDSKITGSEYDQADYLHTFRYHGDDKLVWIPLLGKNELARLEKIYNKISGACIEICPIVPFPAKSMRRVDDILVKHSEILFESFLVSIDNILLCDERTPFDIYRKILEVEEYYRTRLSSVKAIGSVTTVVSPLSSKTLSLGMLLASIEKKLPVCHVEAGTYQIELDDRDQLVGDPDSSPIEIWLVGEPYIK